ncbi:MAG: hypothetical protein MZV64_28940 [Ignavibacteriales bacterium]|nr:hypothetical protein [Ignavibacteriales bacterium]
MKLLALFFVLSLSPTCPIWRAFHRAPLCEQQRRQPDPGHPVCEYQPSQPAALRPALPPAATLPTPRPPRHQAHHVRAGADTPAHLPAGPDEHLRRVQRPGLFRLCGGRLRRLSVLQGTAGERAAARAGGRPLRPPPLPRLRYPAPEPAAEFPHPLRPLFPAEISEERPRRKELLLLNASLLCQFPADLPRLRFRSPWPSWWCSSPSGSAPAAALLVTLPACPHMA